MIDENYFRIIVAGCIMLVMMVRLGFAKKLRQKGIRAMKLHPESLKNEGFYRVLMRVWLGGGIPAYLVFYFFFPDAGFSVKLHFPMITRLIGIIPAISSVMALYFVHKRLGVNWSTGLEVRADHVLVTDGPYARVRHPMYSSLMLFYFSLMLISSDLGFCLVGSYIIIFLATRIRKEEQFMIAHFGKQYLEYREKTGCLFPRIDSRHKQVDS
jgi:protein-S-isoprenylcysteine O-methyltransferase Ste14